jgi:LPS O-antigen subunit length determinant protein (WzzB/FepE family)
MNTNSNQDFSTNPSTAEDEIDLIELLKKVWDRRSLIVKTVLIAMCFGLVVAKLTPNVYEASVVFVPQSSNKGASASGLGGLAALAGVNLGGSSGSSQELGPAFYPELVSDVKFKKALVNTFIHPSTASDSVTFARYYEEIYKPGTLGIIKKYTFGLPGIILSGIRGKVEEKGKSYAENKSDIVFVSNKEYSIYSLIDSHLKINNNPGGFVEISFTMPEPLMAAEMAIASQRLLQQEIIAFRIRNAQEQLEFTEKLYQEKKDEFDVIHARMADFKQRNRNLVSSFGESEEQKLSAEFNMIVSIYTEMANQLEQAKLQVKKDTPVFSILKSITVPNVRSAPNKPLIVFIFIVLGFVFSISYVLVLDFVFILKNKMRN